MTKNQMRAAARKQLQKSKKAIEHLIHGGQYRPRGEYSGYDALDSIDRQLTILAHGTDADIAVIVSRAIGVDYLAAGGAQ